MQNWNGIINFNFNLGGQILVAKIASKMKRSLPKIFRLTVKAIKENKDLNEDRRILGSLQTYELTFPPSKKNKSSTLNTIKEKTSNQIDDDTLKDEFAYFARKFKNFFLKIIRDFLITLKTTLVKIGTIKERYCLEEVSIFKVSWVSGF